jgi:threonine aldolase
MDGARLFNAAVASGHSAKEITSYVDTVQFCLSKGLSAPVGSILAGPKEFIQHARQWRKRLGGGLRQAGVLAAPGILALTTMVERLVEDHENAHLLADNLATLPNIVVNMETVQTNIVLAEIQGTGMSAEIFVQALREQGVWASVFGPASVRFVTHKDVTRQDVLDAAHGVANVLKGAY